MERRRGKYTRDSQCVRHGARRFSQVYRNDAKNGWVEYTVDSRFDVVCRYRFCSVVLWLHFH